MINQWFEPIDLTTDDNGHNLTWTLSANTHNDPGESIQSICKFVEVLQKTYIQKRAWMKMNKNGSNNCAKPIMIGQLHNQQTCLSRKKWMLPFRKSALLCELFGFEIPKLQASL